MRYFCCDERRREAVRATDVYNGIEFLEVVDTDAPADADRQRFLRVHLLKPPEAPLDAISRLDVHVEGGTRVTGIRVVDAGFDATEANVLVVFFNDTATSEIYTLSLHDALPISWSWFRGWPRTPRPAPSSPRASGT